MLIIESKKYLMPLFLTSEKKLIGYYNHKFNTYLILDYETCNKYKSSFKELTHLTDKESYDRFALKILILNANTRK